MSKRQQITDKLKTMLQDIKIANGYNSDLGNNVFEWRLFPFQEDNLPAIEYRDIDCEIESPPARRHDHKLAIDIEIITASGSTTPETIRKMIEDVHKAIGKNAFFDKLAIKTGPVSNSIQMEQDNKIIAGALLKFSITYATGDWET